MREKFEGKHQLPLWQQQLELLLKAIELENKLERSDQLRLP